MTMVRSEGNMSLKNPVTPPGIDPGTVRLVAQRLNHYATPGPRLVWSIIIIIIIIINCNWVVTRWQWLFYMYTNMKKKVTRKFKSGGLHEKHVVATWKLGYLLSIRL